MCITPSFIDIFLVLAEITFPVRSSQIFITEASCNLGARLYSRTRSASASPIVMVLFLRMVLAGSVGDLFLYAVPPDAVKPEIYTGII